MAEVTYEKTGPVTGRIQLNFSKEELGKKLNEELKKESKRVNIKGFRRGKTPISALRKLMGNQVFGPLLDRTIQEELFGYIEENEIRLIFSPIPDEEEQVEQISATNIRDLKLSYDLGLEPEFELSMPEQSFDKYVLDTNEEFLDEQIENLRKQRGESKEIEEGPVGEEDILDVTIQEVDGELSNSTKLYVDNLNDDIKSQLIGQNAGASITVDDLTTVEANGTEANVKKYLLELDEDAQDTDLSGKSFTITIDKISRLVPAELNEEFFIQFDPTGEVTTEEQLRERLAANAAEGFNAQGISMANFMIQRALVEGNDFEVPTELMKKMSKDDKKNSFEHFERGVRWMLIRNKIAEAKEIELEYEDVRAEALENLMRMLGGQRPDFLTDEFLDNYIQNMLKDEKQREELSSNAMEKKIMNAIRADVTLEEKPLSVDEFNKTIKEFNEANTPEQEEE
ncbi:trigger factor [Lewinella aquimaris]|uniref:Trigger factor n=1 Tax=Neolewinella aquimaris TaxID=1835722 RepID=A0A840E145_9BACT|nr:trigger factor [Neolewinella aquimaris]MBB4078931.1 trigger factor [Neolewinella aquimaris]